MSLQFSWTAIGIIVVLLVHGALLVRGWTVIEMRLQAMTDEFKNMNEGLKKRDERMDAAWKKIDGHEHRITVIETKCKVALNEEE